MELWMMDIYVDEVLINTLDKLSFEEVFDYIEMHSSHSFEKCLYTLTKIES